MGKKKMDVRLVELVEEDGQYYIHAKYRVEDEHRIEEYEIPKIRIPFNLRTVPYIDYRDNSVKPSCVLYAGGSDALYLEPGETEMFGDREAFFTVRTVKEKPQKLTVEEIESKLGYKIEIVSKKG